MSVKNLVGLRFGRLVVTGRAPSKVTPKGQARTYWNCTCDCGATLSVAAQSLKVGKSKSCGCYRADALGLPKGVAARNIVLRNYKRNARERGFSFDLSDERFFQILQNSCYFCGQPPTNQSRGTPHSGVYVYSGVDRLDSSLGYTEGNTVPACKQCNWAKTDLALVEFFEFIRRVYEKHIKAA